MGFYVIIIYRSYVLFNCKSFIEALHDFVELHNVKEIKAASYGGLSVNEIVSLQTKKG